MVTTKCGFDTGPGGTGAALLTQFGPTIWVDIGFDENYTTEKGLTRELDVRNIHALVDTGASINCIDNGLAIQLKLPIFDRQKIGGVGGLHEVNMYLAQVHVPALNSIIYGGFAGVDLVASGQMHSALIGRTFLAHFTMVYEGRTGTVTLSDD